MSFTNFENQKSDEVKELLIKFCKMLNKMKKIAFRSKNYKELVKRVKGLKAKTMLDVLEFHFRNSNELFAVGSMYSRRAYMDKLESTDLEDSDDDEYDDDGDSEYDYDAEDEAEELLSYDVGYDSDNTVEDFETKRKYNDSVDEFRSRCKVQHLLSKILWLRKGAKFVLDNINYGAPEHFNLTPFRYLLMHRERVLCAIGCEYNESFEVKYRYVKKALDCLFIANTFAVEYAKAQILHRIDRENKLLDDFITNYVSQPPVASQMSLSPPQASRMSLSPPQASRMSLPPQHASEMSLSPPPPSQMSLSPPSASTFDASIDRPLRLPTSINAHIIRPAAFTWVEPAKEQSLDSSASCANQNTAHTLTSIESVPITACIEIKQEPLQQQQPAALFNIAIKQEPTKARTTIKRKLQLPFSLKLRPRSNGKVIKE